MVPMAAESAAPQLAPSLPVPRSGVSAIPRPRPRVPVLELALFLAAWVVVVGAALLLLSRYDTSNRISDQNAQARQEVAHLAAENQTLQQKIDEFSSPERIYKLATEKLHMVAPARLAVAQVDLSQLAQRPAPSLAAANPAAAHPGLWQRLVAWYDGLRSGRSVAQGR